MLSQHHQFLLEYRKVSIHNIIVFRYSRILGIGINNNEIEKVSALKSSTTSILCTKHIHKMSTFIINTKYMLLLMVIIKL